MSEDTLTGEWDENAGARYEGLDLRGWATFDGVGPTLIDATDITEGMRVKMPTGQVVIVTAVSEPDSDGIVRVTCSTEERP